MRTPSRLNPLLLLFAAPLFGSAQEPRYVLPAAPFDLVTSAEKFRAFAGTVRADVERQFGVPADVDDPAVLKILLSTRVHLAHYFGEDDRAIVTAAWIRSLQANPADKAFAGLTTLAAVAARQENPGHAPGSAGYRAVFAREFAHQLAGLPHTPAIVAMLRQQREKIAGLTEAGLLAETREQIVPAITRRGFCGRAEADQLVRVHHRLTSILPVKAETLAAVEAAIADRPSP